MQCVSIWKSQKNLVTQDLPNDRQTRLQSLAQIFFFFLMHWYQSLMTDVEELRHTDLDSHCNWFKNYYLMEAKENNQQVSIKTNKRCPPPPLSGTAHLCASWLPPHTPIQITYNNGLMIEGGMRIMPSSLTKVDMPPSIYLFLNVNFHSNTVWITYNEFIIIAFKGFLKTFLNLIRFSL